MTTSTRPLCRHVLFAAVAVFVAGCSSISLPTDRFRLSPFQEEYRYTQDVTTTMTACRAVLEEMGFVLDHGREKAGRLEMVSRPRPGDAAETRNQRRAIVSAEWTSEGTSHVRIGFWDENEDPSDSESVPVSGQIIRGGALYDAFWQRMDTALPPGSSVPEPEPPAPAAR